MVGLEEFDENNLIETTGTTRYNRATVKEIETRTGSKANSMNDVNSKKNRIANKKEYIEERVVIANNHSDEMNLSDHQIQHVAREGLSYFLDDISDESMKENKTTPSGSILKSYGRLDSYWYS